MAYLDEGTQTKPVYAGWAANAGVSAVEPAACGAEGPAAVPEGRYGPFAALLDRPHDVAGTGLGLGARWELGEIAYKPYPCCPYSHGALAAGEQLLAGVDAHALAEVIVRAPATRSASCSSRPRPWRLPRSRCEAQFSLPWSLAALLLSGRPALATYGEPALSDPAIRALPARVRYERGDFDSYPGAFPGAVRAGGAEAIVEYQPCSPQRPLSDEQVLAKFSVNATLALHTEAVGALERALERLEAITERAGAAEIERTTLHHQAGRERRRARTRAVTSSATAGASPGNE